MTLGSLRGDSVSVGEALSLDGTGSTSPSDSALDFQWSLVKKPEASVATIENAQEANARFTPDGPGWYTIRLSVDDGDTDSNAELSFLAEGGTPRKVPEEVEEIGPVPDPWARTWMGHRSF